MKRFVLAASISLAIAAACLAVYSFSAAIVAAHRQTTHSRDASVAEGAPGAWLIEVQTDSATIHRGALLLTRARYEAPRPTRPTAAQDADFAASDGWTLNHVASGSMRRGDMRGRTFFDSLRRWRFLGVGVYDTAGGGELRKTLELPLWLLALFLAAPAILLAFRAARRRRRLRAGLCPHCGHDLSGAMVVCPECGRDLPRTSRRR